MVTENTQYPGSPAKPGTPVTSHRDPEGHWSDDDATHKALMRLDDPSDTAPHTAAPSPPGDTATPPPGKSAKSAGGDDSKSPNQEAKSNQPNQPAQANQRQAGTTSATNGTPANQQGAAKPAAPPRPVSEAKVKMQQCLPALTDDDEIGKEKEQTVGRDGKADLGFTGTLLGSAASSAPKGQWQELRVYSTSSGKHVFSRVTRSIFADENDKHEADVFEPSPSSVPSQLMRSAREIARSKPLTWMDAATAFFGYDPLAKVLYRKLSVKFEEQI